MSSTVVPSQQQSQAGRSSAAPQPSRAPAADGGGGAGQPAGGFRFPDIHAFPPFYTRQRNATTAAVQQQRWGDIVLAYCRHHRLFRISLSGAPVAGQQLNEDDLDLDGGTAKVEGMDTTDLFHNRAIGRRLHAADARWVVAGLIKQGRAEWYSTESGSSSTSGGLNGAGGGEWAGGADAGANDVAWIYWRTPEEWAALVEGWVDETGHRGAVMTLYELVQGEGTRSTGLSHIIASLRCFVVCFTVAAAGSTDEGASAARPKFWGQ